MTAEPLKVADLSQTAPTPFEIRPDAAALAALAAELGIDGIRKLSFTGTVAAEGRSDWRLDGHLGATVVQPCVVTLAPVRTRIETAVHRSFVAGMAAPEAEEAEIPEDVDREPLGRVIDPWQVMAEALALAIPQYPRADGAELGDAAFTEPGKTALTDDDLKPFAGLEALKARMRDDG